MRSLMPTVLCTVLLCVLFCVLAPEVFFIFSQIFGVTGAQDLWVQFSLLLLRTHFLHFYSCGTRIYFSFAPFRVIFFVLVRNVYNTLVPRGVIRDQKSAHPVRCVGGQS